MNKINYKHNLWDLHVHTPHEGPKSHNNYDGDSLNEFTDKMVEIINNNPGGLDMLSFTDHNFIYIEAYELMKTKLLASELSTVLLPGVEVDIYLTNEGKLSKKSKHLIFYFEEDSNIRTLGKKINDFLSGTNKLIFGDFVNFLFEEDLKFAISPHSLKQGVRGITSDWTIPEKNSTRIKMYTGLFFVFWEANNSNIQKAIDFIEEFADDSDEINVVSFSDSSNYSEFEKYINKPPYYFRTSNSFRGLQMAGTEISRLIDYSTPNIDKSNIISSVKFHGKHYNLSDKLNVIIGGRGNGKSVLLESIARNFSCNNIIFNNSNSYNKNRLDFLDKNATETYDENRIKLRNNFEVTFINQSFINGLFINNKSDKLEIYFNEEINKISIKDSENIINENKLLIDDNFNNLTSSPVNVINISDYLININDSEIYQTDKTTYTMPEFSIGITNKKGITKLAGAWLKDLISQKIVLTEEINSLIDELDYLVIKEYVNNQLANIEDTILKNSIKKSIDKSNNKLSKEHKKKQSVENDIKNKLRNEYKKYMNKINLLNTLYSINNEDFQLKIKDIIRNGYSSNKFIFANTRVIEHPVEYAKRIIIESLNGNIINKKNELSTKDVFYHFLFTGEDNPDIYNSSSSSEILFNDIKELRSIKFLEKVFIFHFIFDNDEYSTLVLNKESPGTQTNSIMEYVFHKTTDIPLLVDQPEDNVDNKARFTHLTKWILTSKFNRQIILVSHDANIVINGDAENLIIAKKYDNSSFQYTYGSLEFEDNLEQALIILDGGKNALKKRSKKYGLQ